MSLIIQIHEGYQNWQNHQKKTAELIELDTDKKHTL